MRKIILTLFSMLVISALSAQYYYVPYINAGKNPGDLNKDTEFPLGAGLSAGWTAVLAGNQTSPAWSNRTKLPFTFNFNGTNYDSFYVSSSGVLTFSATVGTAPAYANTALPDANIPDNSACIRGILSAGSNSSYANIVTKTFGTTGKRQFYVTFSAYNELSLGTSAYIFVSIMLEEGSNNIYFVDQRKAPTTATKLTVGVQVNSTTATVVAGSPNVNFTAGSIADASDNSYYKFAQGPQAAYDVEGVENAMPDYLALTQLPFNVFSSFKNIGTSALTSCDINYSINNGAAVTAPATISIAKNGTATVTSTAKWTPSNIGTYKVTVWLSNLNSNADENGLNDSATKSVIVVDDYVARIPLCEVFTSSTCGPCVAGNRNTDDVVFPQFPNQFTVIKYQMSWPGTGDPYTTPEGNVRRSLYAVNSIPNMQVDGGWNSNAQNFSATLMNQFKAKPSFIKIESTHTINFKNIKVDVKLTPLSDFNNSNMRLFVAICEKITYKNVKSNGETEFHHVLKKMLPDANGTSIGALTKGTPKTFPTFNFVVPGTFRLPTDGQTANIINVNTENSFEELEDCEVVVFVQDLTTKEVYQSANSSGTLLSVEESNKLFSAIAVYPNPSNSGSVNIRFNLLSTDNVKVNIYNALGQIVDTYDSSSLIEGSNNLLVNTEKYSSGIYTVKIEGNGFSSTEKFIVQ